MIDVYTDGGVLHHQHKELRQAKYAFLVFEDGKMLYKEVAQLGNLTNFQAEYEGVCRALNWLIDYIDKNLGKAGHTQINVFGDNEVVVNQINGLFAIRNSELRAYWKTVQAKIERFKLDGYSTNFQWVSRDANLAGSLLE